MIISPGRNYIFVHIPKTGGTSLALALEARAMRDDILIGDTPKAKARRKRQAGLRPAGRLWKHSRLSDIEGILSAEEIHAMRIVTIVRDPWDRMVSYYHWLRAQRFAHPAVERAKAQPFGAFLSAPATQAEMGRDQVADYLRTTDGREAEALVLHTERLHSDLPRLEEALSVRLDLSHVNRSERPSGGRHLYDPESHEIVARLYARDIARFGYSFDAPG